MTDYFEIDILELPKVEKYYKWPKLMAWPFTNHYIENYKRQKNENLLLWTKFLQNSQCMNQKDFEENKNIEKEK